MCFLMHWMTHAPNKSVSFFSVGVLFSLMDIVEALKSDLGKELAVIDVYKKYAEQIQDTATRQIFMTLINESIGHANSFRQLLLKKTMGLEAQEHSLNDVALASLLDFGMKEEREMRLAYEQKLGGVSDEEYATTLRRIIEDEKRHEAMLKEAYSRLKG